MNAGKTIRSSPTMKQGAVSPRSQDRVVMARDRPTAGEIAVAVMDRPAGDLEAQGDLRPPLRVVVPEDRDEFDPASVEPAIEREQVRLGPTATTRGLDQISRDDQTVNLAAVEERGELGECLAQAMLGQAIPPGGPGPLVAQVDVGDHGDPLFHVERRPFGSEHPAVRAGDHGATRR